MVATVPKITAKLCERCKKVKVPKDEWPVDPYWPTLCRDCLKTYTAP